MLTIAASLSFFFLTLSLACGASLDDLLKAIPSPPAQTARTGSALPDQKTMVSGLKEALALGTEHAVKSVSRVDGYFGNQLIKILLPEKMEQAAGMLAKVGFQKQVDSFVLSMNRAAEAAGPKAVPLFSQALREMTFDDAKRILQGGDTAATDYFKGKTSAKLYEEFKPVISSTMGKVGTTKAYEEMMKPAASLPFFPKESLDLDHYVTTKALDGLFLMVGQEEKKIRTDPGARVTDLLKTVFGR